MLLEELLDYTGGYDKLVRVEDEGERIVSPRGMGLIEDVVGKSIPPGFPRYIVTNQGKIATRVADWAKAMHGVKLSGSQKAKIGTVAEQNTSPSHVLYFSILEGIMRWDRSGTFREGGSCYYGGMANSRPILEDVGGVSLAMFRPGGGPNYNWYGGFIGQGRAWLVPYDGDLIVTNIYYRDDNRQILTMLSKILTEQSGKQVTYSEISLSVGGAHINGGEGYRLSAGKVKTGSVRMKPSKSWHANHCTKCKKHIFYSSGEERAYCDDCGTRCKSCGGEYGWYSMTYVHDKSAWYCFSCAGGYHPCDKCGRVYAASVACTCQGEANERTR